MRESLPLLNQTKIDNIDFARKALKIHGIMLVSHFSRMNDVLANDAGTIECTLMGGVNSDGQPVITMNLSGALNVQCQRCLEAYSHPIDLKFDYLVAHSAVLHSSEDEWEGEGDDFDIMDVDSQMSILDLVEDELLLALPIAPKHEKGCDVSASLPREVKENPFAVLAQLKRGK